MDQLVKNPPARQKTCVQSPGWEDPQEKGKSTHSSVLVWRIPVLLSPWACKESDRTERLSLTQISQVKNFRAFLCMRRCKGVSSQKPFLSYASQLSVANILCFPGLTREGGCSLMAAGWQALFSSLSSLSVHWLTVEGCNG